MDIHRFDKEIKDIYLHRPLEEPVEGEGYIPEDAEYNRMIKIVQEHIDVVNKKMKGEVPYNINEEELLSIMLLEGFGADIIQYPLFYPSKQNSLTRKLVKWLDDGLEKTPKTTHKILYRNDADKYDTSNFFHKDKIYSDFSYPGFLTTSKDNFEYNVELWIITPLQTEKTRAHDLYMVYNHGQDMGKPDCPISAEWQIEFERGTKFRFIKEEKNKNENVYYLQELEKR